MRLRPTSMVCLLVLLAVPAAAQRTAAEPDRGPDADDPTVQAATPDSAQLEELRRRVDVLAAELEQLRSGETPQRALTDERRRSLGLAPSAAATYRRPTRVFMDVINKAPATATLPGVFASPGGVPIMADGKVIGAVGVSGVTGDQDEQCAKAGLGGGK